MAGRVKVHVWPAAFGGMRVQPVDCPAAPDAMKNYPACLFADAEDNIHVCPFLYGVEIPRAGLVIRAELLEVAVATLYNEPELRSQARVLCLRMESKDTPAGATGQRSK